MSTAIEKTLEALEQVVENVPVGTNLALVHLLWALITGAFLSSRGAIFSALSQCGFSAEEVRRSWQAMADGTWSIGLLVKNWRAYVASEGEWQPNRYEGYQPLAIDTTVFWRPRLMSWAGKFFHRIANRALKGVGFGLLVQVGQIDGQRVPLLKAIIPVSGPDESEDDLKHSVLWHVKQQLADDEVAIHDAGVSIANLQEEAIPRFVVRLASNCTARRNVLRNNKKGRPVEYGVIVRPVPRKYKGRTIPATAPDETTTFEYQGRTIGVQGWHGLVRRDQKVSAEHQTYSIWVYSDPLYQDPLVLGVNLVLLPESAFLFYRDRWPVEEVPLVAKQLLGLHRHFVWALLSVIRLPALVLLVANILTHLAASLPPMPTGFWDRHPKKTPGRLRRILAQALFPRDYPFGDQLRKKRSSTAHLPNGFEARRMAKAPP